MHIVDSAKLNTVTETSATFDDLGRAITRTEVDPDGNGPLHGLRTEYHYDADSNLVSEKVIGREQGKSDQNRVTNYSYDRRGHNWKTEAPEVQLTSIDEKSTYNVRPTCVCATTIGSSASLC